MFYYFTHGDLFNYIDCRLTSTICWYYYTTFSGKKTNRRNYIKMIELFNIR